MNPGVMPSPAGIVPLGAAYRLILLTRLVLRVGDIVPIPAGCFYDIIAIGASGSGGAVSNASGRASGGGGPGLCRDWGYTDIDFNLVVTVGLGGLANTPALTARPGNPGGLTTIQGLNVNMSITGGLPGQASTVVAAVSGGLGGIPSGGKLNRKGSRGGNIANVGTGQKATGGGSIQLYGNIKDDGARGGDITTAIAGGQATGGGGVGGRGGDNPTANAQTAGGGAGGPAADGAPSPGGNDVNGFYSTPNTKPATSSVIDIILSWPGLECTASGSTTATALEGAGAPGRPNSFPGLGAAFGGGGGVYYSAGTTLLGGDVALGGGSAGAVGDGTVNATSGKAGDGLVIVSIFREQR